MRTVLPTKSLLKEKIGRGIHNRVARHELANSLGVSCETIRRCIKELRREGELICATQKDWCYYYPTNADDALQMITELMDHNKVALQLITALQEYVKMKTDGVVAFNNLPDIDFYTKENI